MKRNRRTKTAEAVPAVSLDAAAADAYARYHQARIRVRKLRQAEREMQRAGEELERAFGAADLGKTEEGDVIVRFEEERNYPPLEAKTIKFSRFKKLNVPIWDLQ